MLVDLLQRMWVSQYGIEMKRLVLDVCEAVIKWEQHRQKLLEVGVLEPRASPCATSSDDQRLRSAAKICFSAQSAARCGRREFARAVQPAHHRSRHAILAANRDKSGSLADRRSFRLNAAFAGVNRCGAGAGQRAHATCAGHHESRVEAADLRLGTAARRDRRATTRPTAAAAA